MNFQEFRNLQEAYLNVYEERESICEGFKRYPDKKVSAKINRMYDDPDTDIRFGDDAKRRNKMKDVTTHMRGETHPLLRAFSPKKSKAKEKENRARGEGPNPKINNEEYDLYDIILSHLIDEGYAETVENAESIMVNMSEDWRESICEGFKRYPDKKVSAKINRMYDDPDTDIRFGDDAKRRNKMKDVTTHMRGETHPLLRAFSPKKSKAKEKENRARGVSDN